MEKINIECKDGYQLKCELYKPDAKLSKGKFLIINSATGVSKGLYKNYANHFSQNGYDVLIYDYRGIAASRPKRLKNFKASFTIWGQEDFTSVINYVKKECPSHKILVLGHSIGGSIIGMSKECASIDAVINIGAQTSYYKDWDKQKYKLYFLWHMFLPFLTMIFGYFPGKRMNFLEDIPKGVINQWNVRRKDPDMVSQLEKDGHEVYYDLYKGKLLTLAIEDDVIGTKKALRRLIDLFKEADKEMILARPKDIGANEIGHFGFFSRKFKPTLWQTTMDWYDKI